MIYYDLLGFAGPLLGRSRARSQGVLPGAGPGAGPGALSPKPLSVPQASQNVARKCVWTAQAAVDRVSACHHSHLFQPPVENESRKFGFGTVLRKCSTKYARKSEKIAK